MVYGKNGQVLPQARSYAAPEHTRYARRPMRVAARHNIRLKPKENAYDVARRLVQSAEKLANTFAMASYCCCLIVRFSSYADMIQNATRQQANDSRAVVVIDMFTGRRESQYVAR